MNFDFSKFATGGALRPDSFSGMDPRFRDSLAALFENAPPDIQANLRVYSGYRSPEKQDQLWQEALKKYGSPEVARKWVAPPGHSNHNHGDAADLRFLDPAAQQWAHQHAAQYGLTFPLSNENWHIEPAGLRGHGSGGGGGHGVAPPLPAPVDVAANPVPPMPSPDATAPAVATGAPAPGQVAPEGGLSALFSALAPASGAMGGGQQGAGMGQPAATFGTGDPMGAVNAADAAKLKAQGLFNQLAPNVDALMAMGKRPNGSVTVG